MVAENGVSADEQVLGRLWQGMLDSPQVALDRETRHDAREWSGCRTSWLCRW